jgi:hypothetical protein
MKGGKDGFHLVHRIATGQMRNRGAARHAMHGIAIKTENLTAESAFRAPQTQKAIRPHRTASRCFLFF